MVYVHGNSGMGKSTLVRIFLEQLKEKTRNAIVLQGRCYERESVPYKALDGVVDTLGRYLRRLPSVDVQAVLPRDFPYLRRVFPTLQLVEAADLLIAGVSVCERTSPPAMLARRSANAGLTGCVVARADSSPVGSVVAAGSVAGASAKAGRIRAHFSD